MTATQTLPGQFTQEPSEAERAACSRADSESWILFRASAHRTRAAKGSSNRPDRGRHSSAEGRGTQTWPPVCDENIDCEAGLISCGGASPERGGQGCGGVEAPPVRWAGGEHVSGLTRSSLRDHMEAQRAASEPQTVAEGVAQPREAPVGDKSTLIEETRTVVLKILSNLFLYVLLTGAGPHTWG